MDFVSNIVILHAPPHPNIKPSSYPSLLPIVNKVIQNPTSSPSISSPYSMTLKPTEKSSSWRATALTSLITGFVLVLIT